MTEVMLVSVLLTCHLHLLSAQHQPLLVFLKVDDMGIKRQLLVGQQLGAVPAGVVVIQALLDEVFFHEYRLSPFILSLLVRRLLRLLGRCRRSG